MGCERNLKLQIFLFLRDQSRKPAAKRALAMRRSVLRVCAAAPRCRQLCTRSGSGSSDFFEVMHLQRTFDLQEDKLHQRYKRLMAECHPDRFGTASEEAQAEAAERSAAVTHAYSVLRKPHSRADHLLTLLGAPLNEEDGGNNLLTPEFLMQANDSRSPRVGGLPKRSFYTLPGANSTPIVSRLAHGICR